MICRNCKQEKTIENFSWKVEGVMRESICKVCKKDKTKERNMRREILELREKVKTYKQLISDIILACQCRDSKMLRQLVEKGKLEVGRAYDRKDE